MIGDDRWPEPESYALKPSPWEHKVTVCIAAACKAPDRTPRIVVCTDMRASSVAGTLELSMKIRALADRWFMLTSGPESEINCIAKIAQRKFLENAATSGENIDATIRAIVAERKRQKADEHLQAKYALSYANFIDYGKAKLSAEAFARTEAEIEKLSSKTELIFVGYIDGEPEVYKVEQGGRSYPVIDFAAIGEGEFLASASLYQRNQNDVKDVGETLFNVYEAKKWAEGVPSVGTQTFMGLLVPSTGIQPFKLAQISILQRELEKVQRRPSPEIDLKKEGLLDIVMGEG